MKIMKTSNEVFFFYGSGCSSFVGAIGKHWLRLSTDPCTEITRKNRRAIILYTKTLPLRERLVFPPKKGCLKEDTWQVVQRSYLLWRK